MIVALRGKIERLEPTFVEVDAGGVIYGLGISLNTSMRLKEYANECVKILCVQIVREDSQALFGFFDEVERLSFERLIKINGVGPKVALAILSTYTPQSFAKILEDKDVQALQRVPGIGTKSAGKIMVELAGFFNELVEDRIQKGAFSDVKREASEALESLGFKSADIASVLKNVSDGEVADVVKEALKILGKKK
ncbi:Holliday junction branch migration protein RuvA [uncultured Helicobacter sp.]|uniref:Holliday junction branch migration protein RuvA n=1 Tax=uncultured Helicobacter sp. TaxID=175537 RepID=UPI001C3BC2E5|nr:Holliday junction branch migration protein RuvA [Candidatus Helicobacter avicola]